MQTLTEEQRAEAREALAEIDRAGSEADHRLLAAHWVLERARASEQRRIANRLFGQ